MRLLQTVNRPLWPALAIIAIITTVVVVYVLRPAALVAYLYQPLSFLERGSEKVLSEKENDTEILVAENKALRGMLSGFTVEDITDPDSAIKFKKTSQSVDFTPVRIVAKPNQTPYGTFIIEGGESLGHKVGQKVFGSPRIVLGEIQEVHPRQSVARLYSARGTKTIVEMVGSGEALTIEGQGNGSFVGVAPPNSEIEGDAIASVPDSYTSSIANVLKVRTDAFDRSKRITLQSPVNLFDISWVLIQL